MATIQNNTMYGVRIQYKGANASAWPSDYVLLAGEVGYELDTGKYKLGDGTKTWAQLDYYSEPTLTAAVETLTGRVQTNEGKITSLEGRMDTAESNITAHGTRLDTAEGNITSHGTRLDTAEGDIDAVEGRMDTAESNITSHGTRLDTAEGNITSQGQRISTIEGITVISGNPAPAA